MTDKYEIKVLHTRIKHLEALLLHLPCDVCVTRGTVEGICLPNGETVLLCQDCLDDVVGGRALLKGKKT